MNHVMRFLLCSCVFLTGTRSALADILYGDQYSGGFGISVLGGSDYNADGTPDFVVGQLFYSSGGSSPGKILVYSGKGPLLYSVVPTTSNPSNWYGWDITNMGRVDGDQVDDFAVAATGSCTVQSQTSVGSVQIISGASGSVIRTFTGGSHEEFGTAIDGIGDVNSDGVSDIVIGARNFGRQFTPVQGSCGTGKGRWVLLSGADGTQLAGGNGTVNKEGYGVNVAGLDDINNDGTPDFAIVQNAYVPGVNNSNVLRVYSGSTKAELYAMLIPGTAIARLGGDVNADGYKDFIVGVSGASVGGNPSVQQGAVYILSGINGNTIRTVSGDKHRDAFGAAVAPVGDVNADGIPDFIASAVGDGTGTPNLPGYVRVISGANGTTLANFRGIQQPDFGLALSKAGDTNGNGKPDYLIGTWSDSTYFANGGSVRILPGRGGDFYTIGDDGVAVYF